MADKIILSILAPTTILAQTPPLHDGNPSCNCFLVSGKDPGYFQNHHFIDFRNMTAADGEDFTKPPALLGDSDDQGAEAVTSSYFSSSVFTKDWTISNGTASFGNGNTTIAVESARNVFFFREDDITYLALRAQRLDSFASIAEIDSKVSNILYSSLRTRARIVPALPESASLLFADTDTASIAGLNSSHPVAPGAVLGFFTYTSDTQESDIEILTSDPISKIRYSNQPDYDAATDSAVPGASTQQLIANTFDWTDWHDHRIDWYDGVSRWYVDDRLVLEKTLNVPMESAQLVLNVWSDGGSWSQDMTVGAQVVGAFQWIEMVYNISAGNGGSSQCSIGCNVDGVRVQGTPEKAFGNHASQTGHRWSFGLFLGLLVVCLL